MKCPAFLRSHPMSTILPVLPPFPSLYPPIPSSSFDSRVSPNKLFCAALSCLNLSPPLVGFFFFIPLSVSEHLAFKASTPHFSPTVLFSALAVFPSPRARRFRRFSSRSRFPFLGPFFVDTPPFPFPLSSPTQAARHGHGHQCSLYNGVFRFPPPCSVLPSLHRRSISSLSCVPLTHKESLS